MNASPPLPTPFAIAARFAALAILSLAALSVAPIGAQAQAQDDEAKTIRMVIDYGDGVEAHFKGIAWRKGMTVFDAMLAAKSRRRGLTFEHTGRGETAFIRSIDGLPNEGGGSGKRNWVYRVNGETARRGCGAQTLEPSDTVIWAFSTSGLR